MIPLHAGQNCDGFGFVQIQIKKILFVLSYSNETDELTKDKYLFSAQIWQRMVANLQHSKSFRIRWVPLQVHIKIRLYFWMILVFQRWTAKIIYCLTSSMKSFPCSYREPWVIHHINSKPLYHYCRSNIIQLSYYKYLSQIYFSIPIRKFDVFNRSFIGPFGLFLDRCKIVSESYKQWITCWMTTQDNPQYTQHWHDAEKLTPENFIHQVNKSYAILIEHLAFRNIAVTEIENQQSFIENCNFLVSFLDRNPRWYCFNIY